MSKNILITGIGGFVGSHLVNYLKQRGDNNIVGIIRDQIPSMWLDEALDNVVLVQGDIRNFGLLKRVIGHYSIDQIYHFAASAQVKEAWKDPIGVFQTNVIGTVNLLEAVRKIDNGNNGNGNKIRVLIFNTDKIYGEKLNATEDDCYEASEPYATSKCCQGLIGLSYKKTYDMNVVMTSCCNIFGYDPFNSRLIPNVVKQCILGQSPIVYTNDRSIREYIFIDDVVDAVTRIMNKENMWNIYNISTGYVFNQKDVIARILEHFPDISPTLKDGQLPIQIQEETMSSLHWDWKPSVGFDEGLKKTIEQFEYYEDDWNKR